MGDSRSVWEPGVFLQKAFQEVYRAKCFRVEIEECLRLEGIPEHQLKTGAGCL